MPATNRFAYLPKLLALLAIGLLSLPLLGCRPTAVVFEVASSSMAPTLLGPTHTATCLYCHHDFAIAADTYRPEFPTRCGHCGGACHVSDVRQAGVQVGLVPLQPNRRLERMELVAFVDRASGTTQVKRIWGLPGERVLLQQGEVYLARDGGSPPRLFQKSLGQLRKICVPVACFPRDQISHWYFAESGDSTDPPVRWGDEVSQPAGPAVPLLLAANKSLQWRYQRPAPVHPRDVPASQWLRPSPVVDDYEVNQGVTCQLHAVEDYLLSLKLETPLQGDLTLWWRRGSQIFPIVFHAPRSRQATTATPATALPTNAGEPLTFEARGHIAIAWCDQRLLVETDLDNRQIDAAALQPWCQTLAEESSRQLDSTPWLQIRATHELRLTEILIARDLYFEPWEPTLAGTDGYFVLGDNLPVSLDSRGELGRIAIEQVVGRVDP